MGGLGSRRRIRLANPDRISPPLPYYPVDDHEVAYKFRLAVHQIERLIASVIPCGVDLRPDQMSRTTKSHEVPQPRIRKGGGAMDFSRGNHRGRL
jgi:hypothetical protein